MKVIEFLIDTFLAPPRIPLSSSTADFRREREAPRPFSIKVQSENENAQSRQVVELQQGQVGRLVRRRNISKELSTMFGSSRITLSNHSVALEDISGMDVDQLIRGGFIFLNGEDEVGIVRSSNGASFLKRRIVEVLSTSRKSPISVRELVSELKRSSVKISKTGVNSILYSNSGTVFQRGLNSKWRKMSPSVHA